jgi:hypothetical protein
MRCRAKRFLARTYPLRRQPAENLHHRIEPEKCIVLAEGLPLGARFKLD